MAACGGVSVSSWPWRRFRVRVLQGEKGGGEGAEGRGGPLYPPWGARERGGARGGHGDVALVAAVFPLSPQ